MYEGLLQDVLDSWKHREWSVQGFGMLRTYLDNQKALRLQVWDQRLTVWGVTSIHDHPWDFQSTILCGNLWNQRYKEMSHDTFGPLRRYNAVRIVPGEKGGPITENVEEKMLVSMPLEMYGRGETYSQRWDELHRTRYDQSTVTVIHRDRVSTDEAWSMWEKDGVHEGWTNAEPRPATEDEILLALQGVTERFTI